VWPWHTGGHDKAHKLPVGVNLAVTFVIGVMMASLSVAMVFCDAQIIVRKFDRFEALVQAGQLPHGILFVAFVAFCIIALASTLVVLIFPMAAGSGLPEIKGYLNGNTITDFFGERKNWVRAVGAVLATAAGLATGREGPLVTVGGSVGVALAQLMAGRYFRQWVKLDAKNFQQHALVVDENRFAAYKRVRCVMGSAAGLAAAFYSPLGAFLYMFEEATPLCWARQMTFHTFVVVFISSMCARLVFNIGGSDVHQLVIFQESYHDTREWFWADLPCFAIVAVICGFLAAAYTAGSVMIWRMRHQHWLCAWRHRAKCFRILEAAVYAAISAGLMALVPLLIEECTPLPPAESWHGRVWRRYQCPEGTHNQLATMLLQGEEGTIKHLYARSHGGDPESELTPLLICLLVYFGLATGIAGLAIPAGNFVPSMFLGAVLGRLLRQLAAQLPFVSLPLQETSHRLLAAVASLMGSGTTSHSAAADGLFSLAQPGVYAVIGSGAFLGGFTHMTIAVVAILVEATQDIKLTAPLMLSVCIGRTVSRKLLPADFCEMLIVLKGVPYLEPECPHEFEKPESTTGRCCEPVPRQVLLQPRMSPQRLSEALRLADELAICKACGSRGTVAGKFCSECGKPCQRPCWFPMVEPGEPQCTGIVARSRLEHMLDAVDDELQTSVSSSGPSPRASRARISADEAHWDDALNDVVDTDAEAAISNLVRQGASGASMFTLRSDITVDEQTQPALVEQGARIEHSDYLADEDRELNVASFAGPQEDGLLPVFQLADPVPFCVSEDMPIAQVYPLFARAAVNVVIVTPKLRSREGSATRDFGVDHRVCGVLERRHVAMHGFQAPMKTNRVDRQNGARSGVGAHFGDVDPDPGELGGGLASERHERQQAPGATV